MKGTFIFSLLAAASQAVMIEWKGDDDWSPAAKAWRGDSWSGDWDEDRKERMMGAWDDRMSRWSDRWGQKDSGLVADVANVDKSVGYDDESDSDSSDSDDESSDSDDDSSDSDSSSEGDAHDDGGLDYDLIEIIAVPSPPPVPIKEEH